MFATYLNTMPWWVVYLGLGGAGLGVFCQLLTASKPLFRGLLLPLVSAITFAGLGTVAWLTDQRGGVILSAAGLGIVIVMRLGSHLRNSRLGSLKLAVHPQVAWGLLLVGCAVLAVHVAYQMLQAESVLTELPPENAVIPVTNDQWQAETDRGQVIPLLRFAVRQPAEDVEESVLARSYLKHQVIRIAPPDPSCNCHGWVFTGGQCAVLSQWVDRILADNEYQPVAMPRQGDLIVYRNEAGEIEHTGIVEAVGEDGLILIKSKWGPIGLYIHPPQSQPWSIHYAYYRSRRPGHRLKIKPARPAANGLA